MPEIPDDLIDTSTTEGQKQWALLCQRAFENLPTDTTVTFEDIDAILTWCLPEYERMTVGKRRESAYRAGREDEARDEAKITERLRVAERERDSLARRLNLRYEEYCKLRQQADCLTTQLAQAVDQLMAEGWERVAAEFEGEDQDTPEGRDEH